MQLVSCMHYLYINCGRYVPASVCRGKAARGSRLVSQGLGPRLAAGHAAALRARGRGKAAYNLVKIKRLRYYTGFVGNATAVVSCIDSAISQAPNFIKISPVVNKYLRGLKFKNRSRDPDHTPQITSVSGEFFPLMWDLPQSTHLPNLKSVASSIPEILKGI